MQLTRENPGDNLFVRSVDDGGIRVNDEVYNRSIIMTPDDLLEWPVGSPAELTKENLETVLELQPEVLILGTGSRQVFPASELTQAVLSRGIGLEVMTTAAACRTFNVIAGDNRKVVAALIWEDQS